MVLEQIMSGNIIVIVLALVVTLGLLVIWGFSLMMATIRKQKAWFWIILLIPALSLLYWLVQGINFKKLTRR